MSIRYLSGAHHDNTAAVAHRFDIGLLTTPATSFSAETLSRYPAWAADCAAFSKGADHRLFDFDRWAAWAERQAATAPLGHCLFFVAPDAIDVDLSGRVVTSHPEVTIERALTWLPFLRQLGLPTALVAQPGMRPGDVPWDLVDVVFLGGDNDFKLGPRAERVTKLAHSLGKPVHMGRVNTKNRLQLAEGWGCETADGTKLAFGNDANLPGLCRWLAELAA